MTERAPCVNEGSSLSAVVSWTSAWTVVSLPPDSSAGRKIPAAIVYDKKQNNTLWYDTFSVLIVSDIVTSVAGG